MNDKSTPSGEFYAEGSYDETWYLSCSEAPIQTLLTDFATETGANCVTACDAVAYGKSFVKGPLNVQIEFSCSNQEIQQFHRDCSSYCF